MAIVTGFTAERMLIIENASIVDGEVVGNDLILTRFDTSTINAGNVRGPTGSPGVTQGELNARETPVGAIVDYIGITAPANWLAMIGQTIASGQSLYPALWAVIPASMKSGSSIIMPNTKGKVAVGYDSADTDFDSIGEIGGSKTHTLTQAQLPVATITIDPPITNITVDPPNTRVALSAPNDWQKLYAATAGGIVNSEFKATQDGNTDLGPASEFTVNIPPFISTVDIASFQSGNLGSGVAHNNLQPYVTFLKIIKAI